MDIVLSTPEGRRQPKDLAALDFAGQQVTVLKCTAERPLTARGSAGWGAPTTEPP